ncbi:MAG: DNA translocase FtsK 4TM domain-containing protein [Elusimicrobiota bacterium]
MKRKDIIGLILIILSILFIWFLFFPQQSGVVGPFVKKYLLIIFGKASYIFPLVVIWLGIKLTFNKKLQFVYSKLVPDILIIWAICTILSFATGDKPTENFGGFIGKYSEIGIKKIIGDFGGLVVTIGIFVVSMLLTTGISFEDLVNFFAKLIKPRKKKKREGGERGEVLSEVEEKPQELPKVIVPKPPVIIEATEKKEVKQPPIKDVLIKPIPKDKKTGIPKLQIPATPAPKPAQYELPSYELLDEPEKVETQIAENNLRSCADKLIKTLADFDISAKIESINPGPVITRYDIELAPGTKVNSIENLSKDISLAMKAESIRVLAPIPGKSAVGIEIPNPNQAIVGLKDVITSQKFRNSKSLLTFALGKTTAGEPFVDDLSPMPHILIAGATGSGKSVCLNSIVMSLLFKAKPDELKLLLIDPKRLELPVYDGIPHIYEPGKKADKASVITDAKEAAKSLGLLVKVMDFRYKEFAKKTVRDIDGYNKRIEKEGVGKKTYYIVVVIDELADLMLVASREVEENIQRLAQMGRAVGIHLVLATQRPSVDVITGVIKANLPARIAFQVLSQTDSRVILDIKGAEDLLGRGDMLYLPVASPKPTRLQGCFVSLKEVERVVKFVKKQTKPDYEDIFEVIEASEKKEMSDESMNDLLRALKFILERKRVSYELLKEGANFGNKAADILSRLEVGGFIRKPEGAKSWEILTDKIEEFFSKEGKL